MSHVARTAAAAALLAVVTGAARAQAPAPQSNNAVQFHGYAQSREYGSDGGSREFKLERVSLSALAPLPDRNKLYFELYYHEWAPTKRFYVESLFFDTPVGDGRLRIGKGRLMTFGITPSYGNRKTSNYGLLAEAFTQDRVHGIQYMLSKKELDLGLSLHTAYRLGRRNIGDVPGDTARYASHVMPHIALRDVQDQLSRNLAMSGRVGGHWGEWKAGLSGSFGAIDPRDMASLRGSNGALMPRNPLTGAATPAIGPGYTDRTTRMIGLDFTHKTKAGWLVQGECYDARMSELGYLGYEVLGGYEMRNGWKFYTRYGAQDMHVAPTANPLTWDSNQISLSVVQPLHKNLWLQYEYEINGESPNTGGRLKNNVGFVELYTGF